MMPTCLFCLFFSIVSAVSACRPTFGVSLLGLRGVCGLNRVLDLGLDCACIIAPRVLNHNGQGCGLGHFMGQQSLWGSE